MILAHLRADIYFSSNRYMQLLSDNPGFTVVGILGCVPAFLCSYLRAAALHCVLIRCQGVGKSTLLNALAHDGDTEASPFAVAPDAATMVPTDYDRETSLSLKLIKCSSTFALLIGRMMRQEGGGVL